MGDRNAEIWSTRLQREILALESSDDESKKMELLPPFIKTIGHTLSIEGGIAKIEFRIDVELGDEAKESAEAAGDITEEDAAVEGAAGAGDGAGKDEDASVEKDGSTGEKAGEKDTAAGEDGDKTQESGSLHTVESGTEASEEGSPKADPHVIIVLDASMYWKADSSATQSNNPQCYPFQKPLAIVKSGSGLFSGESTISNGDEVDIDLDWTPSIHLSDAVTNVALKIRECVKTGEPLHPSEREDADEGLSGSILREAFEARESLMETKKAVGAMFSSGLSSLSAKGSSLAAKAGESLANLGGEGSDGAMGAGAEEKREVKEVPDIGDEIDLSDEPWNQCIGMYSCKAIKRPAFIEAAIHENQKNESEASSGAGSMFSRFAKSAKSAMQESFLMITEGCIVEFKSSRLNIGSGTVSFAIKIDQMAKLKFRREESLSLFFKQATEDPLVYMCLDSALAVQDIQSVLKRRGVKGKHTNAATQRAVQMALNLVALIQQKEKELIDDPTVDRVNEIMDLYRQAAEKFETAGDPRHTEVMAHMKRFLGQQFTTSILDGSFANKVKQSDAPQSEEKKAATPVPEGEVLEQPTYNLAEEDDHDDDVDVAPKADEKETPEEEGPDELNDSTLQNMEEIMTEAMKDASDLGLEDDEIDEILTSPAKTSSDVDDLTDTEETFAELDAMLNDADKELNELLSS
ncbi:hypothetical protein ACHAXT_010274 [Thalassiosira profunda]